MRKVTSDRYERRGVLETAIDSLCLFHKYLLHRAVCLMAGSLFVSVVNFTLSNWGYSSKESKYYKTRQREMLVEMSQREMMSVESIGKGENTHFLFVKTVT